MRTRPEYIKIVIMGETTVAETIPIGLKEPKILSDIGAVKVWAPVAADKDEAIGLGLNFE